MASRGFVARACVHFPLTKSEEKERLLEVLVYLPAVYVSSRNAPPLA